MAPSYKQAKSFKNEKAAKADLVSSRGGGASWWRVAGEMGAKDDNAATRCAAFIGDCESLKSKSVDREQANIRHARLYENVEINSLTTVDYATALVRQAILGTGIMTLNVVAACVDTLCAKISKNKPRPEFLTSGGSWRQQRKARKLDKWVRGVFYEVDLYEKAKLQFRDGQVFGTGFLKFFQNDDGRLECERTMPGELFVDDADGLTGSPRQMKQRKLMHREVLAAKFPAFAEEILNGPDPKSGIAPSVMVEVWEGWHLPSSKKAKDGKHIIAIQNCELLCEEWKIASFPFVVLRGKSRVVGFWGKGAAEALTGAQLELNRTMKSVSEQIRRKGKGRIYIPFGSRVNKAHITNGFTDIVEYAGGVPPTIDNSNVVSQDESAQIDKCYARAFQDYGVSELSAASRKPAGLDAGVALREYSEIESERFALVHQAWDNNFLECARVIIALVRNQYPDLQDGYKVKLPGRRYAVEVDWKEIDLDEDSYVMQMLSASSLPNTPGARKQFVKELQADGMISPTVAKRLLGFPDVEAEMDLGNAALDDADATISAILDDEEPELHPPEPFQNLELLLERAQANYLFARHFKDIEVERLEMLRSLMEMTANLLAPDPAAMGAPPMAPGAMPGAAPGGVPMPGPTNISNVMNAAPPVPAVAPLLQAA
jgi:hypothetical protein